MQYRAEDSQETTGRIARLSTYGRSEGVGLPGRLASAATILFALSVLGTLAALGMFFWYDADFWNRFEVGSVLKVTTILLSGFVVSSGLLYFHHSYRRTYSTFESLLYATVLLFSLLNLMWIAPMLFFL